MKLNLVEAAIAEAQRFISLARALKAAEAPSAKGHKPAAGDLHIGYSSPREAGALRRASMDLTRALADLRRREEP